jgi:hypothetical protein
VDRRGSFLEARYGLVPAPRTSRQIANRLERRASGMELCAYSSLYSPLLLPFRLYWPLSPSSARVLQHRHLQRLTVLSPPPHCTLAASSALSPPPPYPCHLACTRRRARVVHKAQSRKHVVHKARHEGAGAKAQRRGRGPRSQPLNPKRPLCPGLAGRAQHS